MILSLRYYRITIGITMYHRWIIDAPRSLRALRKMESRAVSFPTSSDKWNWLTCLPGSNAFLPSTFFFFFDVVNKSRTSRAARLARTAVTNHWGLSSRDYSRCPLRVKCHPRRLRCHCPRHEIVTRFCKRSCARARAARNDPRFAKSL